MVFHVCLKTNVRAGTVFLIRCVKLVTRLPIARCRFFLAACPNLIAAPVAPGRCFVRRPVVPGKLSWESGGAFAEPAGRSRPINTGAGHDYTPILPLPSPPLGEVAMELNDPGLFRQQGYIGGAWVDAEDGATFEVTRPGLENSFHTAWVKSGSSPSSLRLTGVDL